MNFHPLIPFLAARLSFGGIIFGHKEGGGKSFPKANYQYLYGLCELPYAYMDHVQVVGYLSQILWTPIRRLVIGWILKDWVTLSGPQLFKIHEMLGK